MANINQDFVMKLGRSFATATDLHGPFQREEKQQEIDYTRLKGKDNVLH